MRKLMWFTIGFVAACAVAVSAFMGVWGLLLSLIVAGAGVAMYRLKSVRSKIVAIILLGVSSGFLWLFVFQIVYLDTPRSYDGRSCYGNVIVSEYSVETNRGVSVDGYIQLEGKHYKIRVYWSTEETLEPGDVLVGKITLYYTGGGEKDPSYHASGGMHLEGYAEDQAVLEKGAADSWLLFPAKMRKSIVNTVNKVFPEDVAGFACALLIGDTDNLAHVHDVSMQTSGIRHVVAVSGLHVSILFSFAYTLAAKHRFWTAVLGLPLLFVFAAVAGFSPSVVRACLMQGIMIVSLLLNKEYDPPTSLATAVLAMLMCNPMLIRSASLQLSVGCIIGIFCFNEPIHDYLLRGKIKKLAKGKGVLHKMFRWIVNTISVSVSATVATSPLVAYYFGTVSLVGVLANILTLWVISFVFYGIMLVCVVSLFSGTVATWLSGLVAWPIRYVLMVSNGLARLPSAAVYTCSIYILIWLVFVYTLLTAFLFMKKKCPAVLLGCMFSGLVLAILAGWSEPEMLHLNATVMDVGQGQCVVLYTNSGAYMVDCGGDNGKAAANSAVQKLRSRGIHHLDGLILTHYDEDHAGGAEYLMEQFPVDRLYLPDVTKDNEIRKLLAENYADRIAWVCQEVRLEEAGTKICLYPAVDHENENESSLSILFMKEECDILITGDLGTSGELDLISKYSLPKVEVLVVGHHGSETSTSGALLDQIRPQQVAISVGKDNRFGHPSKIVTERLEFYDCRIWRTDLDGTIDFRR